MEDTAVNFSQGNAYYGMNILAFEDGVMELPSKPYKRPDNLKFKTVVVKQGDRLDTIATTQYARQDTNPAKWWWLIAEENELENAWDLSELIGQEIRIPDLVQYTLNNQT